MEEGFKYPYSPVIRLFKIALSVEKQGLLVQDGTAIFGKLRCRPRWRFIAL